MEYAVGKGTIYTLTWQSVFLVDLGKIYVKGEP